MIHAIEIDIEKRFLSQKNIGGEGHKSIDRITAKFVSSAGITGVFGKSGSGKTTLVNLIAGIDRPSRGRIVIDGEVLFDSALGIDVPIEKRGIGYVLQAHNLFPHLNVEKNLRYGEKRVSPPIETSVSKTALTRHQKAVADAAPRGAAIPHPQPLCDPPDHLSLRSRPPLHGVLRPAGWSRRERVASFDKVVSVLGIGHLLQRMPSALSGGEKQRVAIGRALLSNPRLLLMDEPLASLDQPRRQEILALIERMRDEFAVGIVYISHSIAEISRLADDVVLMNDGAVIAHGDTEAVFNRRELQPFTGRYEGGTLIEATVSGHDAEFLLTKLRFDSGELTAPGMELPIGSRVRVRVRARDVSIATVRPAGLSIRNVLQGRVTAIDDRSGAPLGDRKSAIVELRIAVGSREFLARISRQAMVELQLSEGSPVFVLIKAIAFDKRSIGFSGG